MKNLFSCASFSFILLAFTLLTSCEKDSYQSAYSYGIFQTTGDLNGFFIADNYLSSKGVYKDIQIFESETKSENDLKAIAFYNEQIAKIDKSELEALLGNVNFEFTYAVKSSISNPDEEAPTLASKKYEFIYLVAN
jgi:hypothetical protein